MQLGSKQSDAGRIQQLADLIVRHKHLYYAGKPEITDVEYDRIEDELRRIAPGHPALSFVGSEKSITGRKIQHSKPMLSLDKTYVFDDLVKWAENKPVVGTVKIDGNSVSLIYRDGKLVLAKTRGNGRIGEDVTDKIRWVSEIPASISEIGEFEVRGEVYCTESQFLRLAHEMESQGLEKPTSPRNIVAGVLGRTTLIENARFFNFFAFDAMSLTGLSPFKTEIQKCDWIESHGFRLPFHQRLKTTSEVEQFLSRVQDLMADAEIGIDGAVFSYDDLTIHEELGDTAHHPRYKLAFKWQGQTAISKIERIEWFTSRLGIVTPVAVIQPVHLSGAQITNITLHNAAMVMNFDLKAGDQIELVRSGEVIPKFLRVVESAPGKSRPPQECPSCGAQLIFDDVRLLCVNQSDCPAQLSGKILNWIRCAEIDDLSEKRLESLIALKLVSSIPDLYRLTVDDLLKLPLTKEKMAQKIYDNIAKTRSLPLARFLNGLGIEGAGLTTWEALLEEFRDLKTIRSANQEAIEKLDGFAAKSAAQIVEGLKDKAELIDELLAVGVVPVEGIARNAGGILDGMTLVITGALSKPRSEIEKIIKAAGGKTSGSVSKHTTALITNETDSSSAKAKKAVELGLPIWTEAELLKKLGY